MSITQFTNSIRSSETTVQLLKDELRKEHETAANYLKEIEASVYRELDNVERFLRNGIDGHMGPNKEALRPTINFYDSSIDSAVIRLSVNDYVDVDLSPIVTNVIIDLKEKIDLVKPDGDILKAIGAIDTLKAAILDSLKERNERGLLISVDSDALSLTLYINNDGEEDNPKDVYRRIYEHLGVNGLSLGSGSMLFNMLSNL